MTTILQSGWVDMNMDDDPYWTNDSTSFENGVVGVTFNCIKGIDSYTFLSSASVTNHSVYLLEMINTLEVLHADCSDKIFPGWESIAAVKSFLFESIENDSDRIYLRNLHHYLTQCECPDLPELAAISVPPITEELIYAEQLY